MPVNALTRNAGLKIGPVVLETLVKHYFDRIKNSAEDKAKTKLRQDELLYDEAFSVVKAFLAAAALHTVEEVQGFANTRTPSPPWVHVVRLLVPMSCCDDAAGYLIKALGGEQVAKRVVGGVKWWQVRGVEGVDGQWIVTRKDWREAKRRHKMHEASNKEHRKSPSETGTSADATDPGVNQQEMDEMRCILYAHGGGYYFGSVDQERYSIQRHARKINGRVFAINYRLAPQYPFPCAIHDLLAAYIFLIRPPPGALHRAVNPAHIVVAGDSAGGGLTIALLQVIRDAGLPLPAGGILVSPWCDLTHSFPSVHTNTATDIIPVYGMSMQKPSTLWPPPSNAMTSDVHASLRSRIRQALRMDDHSAKPLSPGVSVRSNPTEAGMPVNVGATTALPPLHSPHNQTISLVTKSGEELTIEQQVHFYAQNSLLIHPLISPALSYLGGLPPLFFIASDDEVLRDEIMYTAHRAANPGKFPLRENLWEIYPPLKGIEKRYGATPVHLQVYDDAAHILPVLFSFTTPGKFCYRAIATFTRHVTGMATAVPHSPIDGAFPFGSMMIPGVESESSIGSNGSSRHDNGKSSPRKASVKRSLSMNLIRAASAFRKHPNSTSHSIERTQSTDRDALPTLPRNESSSSDVAGPRFRGTSTPQERTAGDAVVYSETPAFPSWTDRMIRERVSTQGVVRPLEPESELDAFHVPPEMIGVLSELAVRRYLDGRAKFDAKFAGTIKAIEKDRRRNLEHDKKHLLRTTSTRRGTMSFMRDGSPRRGTTEGPPTESNSWGYAWALDDEMPPPSSIASRRDTQEARRLARIADQCVVQGDSALSGNSLWAVINNFLTVSPERGDKGEHAQGELEKHIREKPAGEVKAERKSRLHRLVSG